MNSNNHERDKWLPLNQAPPLFPVEPHVGTIVRWALRGVKVGSNGERIRLKTQKVGGRRYTCREWINAFIDQVSGERVKNETLSRARSEALASDERELDDEGIA